VPVGKGNARCEGNEVLGKLPMGRPKTVEAKPLLVVFRGPKGAPFRGLTGPCGCPGNKWGSPTPKGGAGLSRVYNLNREISGLPSVAKVCAKKYLM